MTNADRWLDSLAADAPERELLLAGKAADPPAGSADRGWHALSLALGAGTATAVLSTEAAATAVVAKASVAGKTAVGAVGLSLGVKAVAIGFAVGIGLLGAQQLVTRMGHGALTPMLVTSRPAAAAAQVGTPLSQPSSRPTSGPLPSAIADPVINPEATPTLSDVPPALASATKSSFKSTRAIASAAFEPRESSLADQARELAQVKRLIDAGAFDEALRRLKSSYLHDVNSALSEEREALQIDALSKAQHADEARRGAERFLARYPSSPHRDKMHKLLASE